MRFFAERAWRSATAAGQKNQPKLIYDVPDFHNPSGITMSLQRRHALLELAADAGIAVVEDSPYRKLRFEGATLPSLKSLDRNGIVLALGTFSKLMAPGLRIGWVCGDPDLLTRMARLKSDGGTSPMTQRIILEFFLGGGLEPHLERARAAYQAASRRYGRGAAPRTPRGDRSPFRTAGIICG